MGLKVADMLSNEPPHGTNKLLPSPFPRAGGLRRQSDGVPDVVISNEDNEEVTERTSLLPRARLRGDMAEGESTWPMLLLRGGNRVLGELVLLCGGGENRVCRGGGIAVGE